MDSLAEDKIFVGWDALTALETFLQEEVPQNAKIILLTDHTVKQHCLGKLFGSNQRLHDARIYEIPEGESAKTFHQAYDLCRHLLSDGIEKDTLLINLGGGVVCDLGGFVASIYKRGLGFIHIPTTLLAQVDAAIGGKTAVNLDTYKNQIGTFAKPAGVFVYPLFLNSLNERQIRAGFAEIIKIALIADQALWHLIRQYDFPALKTISFEGLLWSRMIRDSIGKKLEIVRQDPFEKHYRKGLNFGHTVGHAVETYSLQHDRDPLLHGEAVAAGMICETYLSWKHNLISQPERDEVIGYLSGMFDHYPIAGETHDEMLKIMQADKKNKGGKICFVLLDGMGRFQTDVSFDPKIIFESLSYYNSLQA